MEIQFWLSTTTPSTTTDTTASQQQQQQQQQRKNAANFNSIKPTKDDRLIGSTFVDLSSLSHSPFESHSIR